MALLRLCFLILAACCVACTATTSEDEGGASDAGDMGPVPPRDQGPQCDGESTLPTVPTPNCPADPVDAGGCVGLPYDPSAPPMMPTASYVLGCSVALPIRAEIGGAECGPVPVMCHCTVGPGFGDGGPNWACLN